MSFVSSHNHRIAMIPALVNMLNAFRRAGKLAYVPIFVFLCESSLPVQYFSTLKSNLIPHLYVMQSTTEK